ncbi:Crp/Fnr family transcriptional regulator [Flavobacterium sp.]|uniref:Crp/Fnr family transcriptional regulator n=1 Tax=Flavobacterium sp. TaxID=239 RepID=UPI001213B63E|nr:Crp/Fnr family transcriptional regulator [Flavobacterium sp.]RZJ70599.1 MAG: Crp/Fnr family transcriptional regulator [Flavobacterium sp.]
MNDSNARKVFRDLDFTASELVLVESKLEEIRVRKGDLLLSAGQSVPFQYYVVDGCMRTFFITDAGRDFTLQFAVSDWFISDYTAFFTSGISILNIECLQDATLLKLSHQSMEELYREIPAIETFFRIKMERFFGSFQKRILSDLAMSAKEKYQTFLKTYPDIEKHIKNYHLASYLGITTESLSRIRHELARA